MNEAASAAMRRVKFATDREKAFMHELKERVAAYFEERGIQDKADGRMVRKTVLVLAGLVLVIAGLRVAGGFFLPVVLGNTAGGVLLVGIVNFADDHGDDDVNRFERN